MMMMMTLTIMLMSVILIIYYRIMMIFYILITFIIHQHIVVAIDRDISHTSIMIISNIEFFFLILFSYNNENTFTLHAHLKFSF